MSKKVIHFNEGMYLTELSRQTRMQDIINEMLKEAEKAEVEVSDYKEFLKNPTEYVLSQYWEENKGFFPKGIKREKAIEGTEFNPAKIKKLLDEYNGLTKICKGIKVNKKSTVIDINEEDYNWYLNEDKREEYETLEKLIEVLKEVDVHNRVMIFKIQQAVSGVFLVKNGKLEINPNNFRA